MAGTAVSSHWMGPAGTQERYSSLDPSTITVFELAWLREMSFPADHVNKSGETGQQDETGHCNIGSAPWRPYLLGGESFILPLAKGLPWTL